MSHHGVHSDPYPMWATLRDRCKALGLPTWRSDAAGQMIADAPESGLLSLWLQSSPMRMIVSDAARGWSGDPSPRLMSVAPGCWLIPIVIEQRRRRVGMTIAGAFGPEVATTPLFELSCHAAGIDAVSTRAAMKRFASYDERTAARSAELLQWMARDLGSLVEHESAVSGFTLELSQSYETIDLLYTLGRSMRNLAEPEGFARMLTSRLHETLPFGWLAMSLFDDAATLGSLSGQSALHGECGYSLGSLSAFVRTIRPRLERDRATLVTSLDEEADGRILVQPIIVSGSLAGVLCCGDRQGADPQVSSYDMQLIDAAAAFAGAFLENARLYREQKAMFLGSVHALSAAIDAKDRYTQGHSERVAHLGSLLAEALHDPTTPPDRVHLSGLLHDVGKIGVPEAVLCKPGRLTDEEFEAIKKHPQIGFDILSGIPLLRDVLPGVLHHHERYDGKGYPHGLAGERIPLIARILGIADTFDAMSSNRAYRPALPRPKVLEEIRRCAGTQFDPSLAALFVALDLTHYDEMVAHHAAQRVAPLTTAA